MPSFQFFALPTNPEQTQFTAWAVTETYEAWHHRDVFDNPYDALNATGKIGQEWIEEAVPPEVRRLARPAFARDSQIQNNRQQALGEE
jgi:hypothetical protein